MRTVNQKRRNALIAAALGAALLIGGGTYALWSDTAAIEGGTVTAGNLDIGAGEMKTYDVSADVQRGADSIMVGTTDLSIPGEEIDLEHWTIVPGDTIALVFDYEVVLVGDNLQAELTLNASNVYAATSSFDPGNITMEYQVFTEGDATMQARATLPTANDVALATLVPADSGTVVFVLFVTFDGEKVTGQTDVTELLDLSGDVVMKLTQVRP